MDIFVLAVLFIIALAVADLWVGVTNDAVNFLNSAFGSRIARRRTIMGLAALGVLVGALFSNGLMEVARKGVFDPGVFYDSAGVLNLSAILALYLGVMTADILLLDLFNTFGFPTSTTVSIVSELVGASIAVSFWMSGMDWMAGLSVISTGPVFGIYSGIFLSILVAFATGAGVMFLARLFFSHDLARSFPRAGWLWVGLSFASLGYFVIYKGLKDVSFLSASAIQLLQQNLLLILLALFLGSALVGWIFRYRHVAVFKVLILSATCALAMAFAGNDLVNFIGPTVAAGQAVFLEGVQLAGKVQTPTWTLICSGLVMVLALWISRKARTVTDTEVRLAAQGEPEQRFKPNRTALALVTVGQSLGKLFVFLTPRSLRSLVGGRVRRPVDAGEAPPYDLLRASVNLTVASALISLGTANKLPLSTTYITFMVAMGAAMADGTWTRKTAASRITGIMMIVGGWLLTGLIAACGAFAMASIYYLAGLGGGMLIAAFLLILMLARMSITHDRRFGKVGHIYEEGSRQRFPEPVNAMEG